LPRYLGELDRPYTLVQARGMWMCPPCHDGLHKKCDRPVLACECPCDKREPRKNWRKNKENQRNIVDEFGTIEVK